MFSQSQRRDSTYGQVLVRGGGRGATQMGEGRMLRWIEWLCQRDGATLREGLPKFQNFEKKLKHEEEVNLQLKMSRSCDNYEAQSLNTWNYHVQCSLRSAHDCCL